MAINIGDINVQGFYVGDEQVEAIYLGDEQVYQKNIHILSTSTGSVTGTGVHTVDITASDPWTASFDGSSQTFMSFTPNSGVAGVTTMTITITGSGIGDLTITDSTGASIVIAVDNQYA